MQKVSIFSNISCICKISISYVLNLFIFKEPKVKKASDDDLGNIQLLESKVYGLMSLSMELIHTRFVALRNKQSPKVSAIKSNMNMAVAATKGKKT